MKSKILTLVLYSIIVTNYNVNAWSSMEQVAEALRPILQGGRGEDGQSESIEIHARARRAAPTKGPDVKPGAPTPKVKPGASTPKDKQGAPAPKDKPVAQTPKDKLVAQTPKDKPVAQTPTPKDKPVAQTPKDKPVPQTPKDKSVGQTPTPKDKPLAQTPKDKQVTQTPKDKPLAQTPKDKPGAPKEKPGAQTPKDKASAPGPKDKPGAPTAEVKPADSGSPKSEVQPAASKPKDQPTAPGGDTAPSPSPVAGPSSKNSSNDLKTDAPMSTELFQATFCYTLGRGCASVPTLAVQCTIRCAFPDSLITRYIGMLPLITLFTCQGIGTIFQSMPDQLYSSHHKTETSHDILNTFNVLPGNEGDFAKAGANALLPTLVKNAKGLEFDDLQQFLRQLELHERDPPDEEDGFNSVILKGKSVNIKLVTKEGMENAFINKNCEGTDSQTVTLANSLDTRPCLLDVLMPGYFVFSRAPVLARTKRIESLLKAWNTPLFLFTGVKCCMTRFAEENKKYECHHNAEYLNKPHGLPQHSQLPDVCGAIPSYKPSPSHVKPPAQNLTTNTNTTGGEGNPENPTQVDTGINPACDPSLSDYELVEGLEEDIEECTVTTPAPMDYTLDQEEDVGASEGEGGGGEGTSKTEADYNAVTTEQTEQ